MKICSYCGEYKEVRFVEDIESMLQLLKGAYRIKFGGYICKDCDIANKIILKKKKQEREIKLKEKQISWIKERNKILMKIKNG